MFGIIILLLLPLLIYCLGLLYIKYKYSHWKRRNVPYAEPEFPMGSVNVKKSQKHLFMITQQFYNENKGKFPYFGIYSVVRPFVVAIDLEFIKNILTRDFNHFVNRGMFYNEKDEPISAHLFSIENQQWRDLRAKLTPTFTSGKMKFMFPTIMTVAKEFQSCLAREINTNQNSMELKDLLARFTTDVIGTCAFGVDCNSLNYPNSEFREMGRKSVTVSVSSRLMRIIRNNYPALSRKLRLTILDPAVSNFFLNLVRETIHFRKTNNVRRNDFMDIVINLKHINANGGAEGLTVEQIAAQAFIFFFAGFETSSTVMSFALLELAENQVVQDKVRKEILSVMKKYDNELTYEAMADLKYLDQVINETMRKYPPVANLLRIVTKSYNEPISGVKFDKGTGVYIPVYAIHHDPELYPNPEEFNPDRFTEDNIKHRNPYTFLPFGDGPRNCIGLRFGMMQTRIGLLTLLKNFKFSKSVATEYPVKFSISSSVLCSTSGLNLKVEKL